MRLIGIRTLPLLQIFYISLKIPLGTADFTVLFWLGQVDVTAEHGVTRQVGTARELVGLRGYKSRL